MKKSQKSDSWDTEKSLVFDEEGLGQNQKSQKNFSSKKGKKADQEADEIGTKKKEYFSKMGKKKIMKYCESPYNTIRDGTQGSFLSSLEKYLPRLPELNEETNAIWDTIMRVGQLRYETMEEEMAKTNKAIESFGNVISDKKKPKPTLEYRDEDGEIHSPDWMPYERARMYLICLAMKGTKYAGVITGYNSGVITVLKRSDKFFAAMYEEAMAMYNANRNERLSEIMMDRLESGEGSDKLLEFALERLDRQNYNLKAQEKAEGAKNMHIDNAVIYNLQVPPQLLGGGDGE